MTDQRLDLDLRNPVQAHADLSEYIMAWGAEQGVEWCAASLAEDVPRSTVRRKRRIDAETGEVLEAA